MLHLASRQREAALLTRRLPWSGRGRDAMEEDVGLDLVRPTAGEIVWGVVGIALLLGIVVVILRWAAARRR